MVSKQYKLSVVIEGNVDETPRIKKMYLLFMVEIFPDIISVLSSSYFVDSLLFLFLGLF
jgi:hypothetical protein